MYSLLLLLLFILMHSWLQKIIKYWIYRHRYGTFNDNLVPLLIPIPITPNYLKNDLYFRCQGGQCRISLATKHYFTGMLLIYLLITETIQKWKKIMKKPKKHELTWSYYSGWFLLLLKNQNSCPNIFVNSFFRRNTKWWWQQFGKIYL